MQAVCKTLSLSHPGVDDLVLETSLLQTLIKQLTTSLDNVFGVELIVIMSPLTIDIFAPLKNEKVVGLTELLLGSSYFYFLQLEFYDITYYGS